VKDRTGSGKGYGTDSKVRPLELRKNGFWIAKAVGQKRRALGKIY
jgi:hypothetical protein